MSSNDNFKWVVVDHGGHLNQAKMIRDTSITIYRTAEVSRCRFALTKQLAVDTLSQISRLPMMAFENFSYYVSAGLGTFILAGFGSRFDERVHQAARRSLNYDCNNALIYLVAHVYAKLVY